MKMAALVAIVLVCAPLTSAQEVAGSATPVRTSSEREQEIRDLRAELARISARLDALEHSEVATGTTPPASPAPTAISPPLRVAAGVSSSSVSADPGNSASGTAQPSSSTVQSPSSPAQQPLASVLPATLPGGATLNYYFDGYYEYNFNSPVGRVNNLRAYDVLSNTFSINQTDMIFDLDPDVDKGRRYGFRLDLQFGQATDTLQGNPSNEPRPTIYQNIYQAYGSYVFPVGKGLQVDFGKWASSLGSEGNYAKDQMNYTRSFYFYFLPFYHAGVRAHYTVNDKFAVNYWVVNGTNQSEPTNGYKDEMFGFVLTPTKNITWTSNYYLGQEHPNTVQSSSCTYPVQPGLCELPINPAPNGKLHIIDDYVTWQARPKLTFQAEADYVIQREWATAAPGESSHPQHADGGAAYVQYQATPRSSFAIRGEYLSDRGGLFSGATQALKEGTGTYKYTVADGLDAFLEFRRDWTNIPYFQTSNPAAPVKGQSTATLGLVWWYGGKQGSW